MKYKEILIAFVYLASCSDPNILYGRYSHKLANYEDYDNGGGSGGYFRKYDNGVGSDGYFRKYDNGGGSDEYFHKKEYKSSKNRHLEDTNSSSSDKSEEEEEKKKISIKDYLKRKSNPKITVKEVIKILDEIREEVKYYSFFSCNEMIDNISILKTKPDPHFIFEVLIKYQAVDFNGEYLAKICDLLDIKSKNILDLVKNEEFKELYLKKNKIVPSDCWHVKECFTKDFWGKYDLEIGDKFDFEAVTNILDFILTRSSLHFSEFIEYYSESEGNIINLSFSELCSLYLKYKEKKNYDIEKFVKCILKCNDINSYNDIIKQLLENKDLLEKFVEITDVRKFLEYKDIKQVDISFEEYFKLFFADKSKDVDIWYYFREECKFLNGKFSTLSCKDNMSYFFEPLKEYVTQNSCKISDIIDLLKKWISKSYTHGDGKPSKRNYISAKIIEILNDDNLFNLIYYFINNDDCVETIECIFNECVHCGLDLAFKIVQKLNPSVKSKNDFVKYIVSEEKLCKSFYSCDNFVLNNYYHLDELCKYFKDASLELKPFVEFCLSIFKYQEGKFKSKGQKIFLSVINCVESNDESINEAIKYYKPFLNMNPFWECIRDEDKTMECISESFKDDSNELDICLKLLSYANDFSIDIDSKYIKTISNGNTSLDKKDINSVLDRLISRKRGIFTSKEIIRICLKFNPNFGDFTIFEIIDKMIKLIRFDENQVDKFFMALNENEKKNLPLIDCYYMICRLGRYDATDYSKEIKMLYSLSINSSLKSIKDSIDDIKESIKELEATIKELILNIAHIFVAFMNMDKEQQQKFFQNLINKKEEMKKDPFWKDKKEWEQMCNTYDKLIKDTNYDIIKSLLKSRKYQDDKISEIMECVKNVFESPKENK